MKPTFRPNALARTTLALGALLWGPNLAARTPCTSFVRGDERRDTRVERVVAKLKGEDLEAQAARLRRVLHGREAVLDYLPLDRLKRARITADTLDILFDFDGRSGGRLETPDSQLWVTNEKGEAQSVSAGRRTLYIARKVRFLLDGDEIRGVREGDIRVCWGFLKFDLALRTRSTAPRVVRDADGRTVLEVDAGGRPLRRGGRFVPRKASEWLVLEARGRRVEIPLDEAEA